MKISYKSVVPAIAILGGLSLTGCSSNTLTEEEVNEFVEYVYNETISSEFDFYDFKKNIISTIPKIKDKEKTSDIINDYIYMLYEESNKYTRYFNLIGEELSVIRKKLDIKKLDTSMYKEVGKESKAIGAILEEMHDRNLLIIESGNIYTIDVDIFKVIDMFREYLTDDLIEFMEFRGKENEEAIYDVNSDKYNVNLIVERASIALDKVEKNPDSSQVNNWKSTADYYVQLLLAEYTTQFLDTSDFDVKKFSKEYITELKEAIKKYEGKSIHKYLSEYIKVVEENKYLVDADPVVNLRREIISSVYPIEEPLESEEEVDDDEFEEIIDDSNEESEK